MKVHICVVNAIKELSEVRQLSLTVQLCVYVSFFISVFILCLSLSAVSPLQKIP